ncbi:IS5 family transposase [Frankia sp. AgKG'84/4]|uniref:IS5 family transposase n=1 Tax=Frankia sp. AgKG'84/4 TaxID=573490 RepID=UPI0027E4FDC6|nr:IS5 family transposase [Frankia sp. AgKG'84/4]
MPRRHRHRYPSDLTDAQWALIEPLLPPAASIGRREKHDRRDLVDAIGYVVRNGCAWRALPSDYPPWQTVYYYFARWHDQGVTERVHDALRDQLRVQEGRDTEPTAGIIDSQSVKGADTVPAASRGFDMGKKINGRKRFLVVDTLGLLLAVLVVPASTHDTAGGRQVLLDSYFAGRRLQLVFGDGMFAGTIVDWAARLLGLRVQVVRRPAGQKGFEVLPRRWVIERTLAWITGHRRHARDYERRPDHAEALIRWAMIGVMARRIDRRAPARRPGPRPLQRII